jgi:hypothetical protein
MNLKVYIFLFIDMFIVYMKEIVFGIIRGVTLRMNMT